MTRLTILVGAVLWLTAPSQAHAQPTDQQCLDCHDEREGSASREDSDLGVSLVDHQGSAHGELACVDCHTDATTDNCASDLAQVDCADCHAIEAAQFSESVHGTAFISMGMRVSCVDCHGTHDTLPSDDPASSVYPTELPTTCGTCHDSEEHDLPKRAPGVTLEDYVESAHYTGLTDDGLLESASCIGCHGNHGMRAVTDPGSRVHRDNIPETCGECHEGNYEDYITTSHGEALVRGSADTPICTDCHGEHAIFDHEDPRSSVHASRISKSTCPQCHSAEHINRRYGLAEGQVETYQDTFHGLADQYAESGSAHCASCHGAHAILPSSDPNSTVHADNLPTTCGECHPGAGPNFAAGSVHRPAESAGASWFGFVDWFYFIVIGLTLGFMLLHNGLDYFATMRERFRARRRRRRYLRFDVGERVQHIALVLSFVVLAVSGFALKYPQAFWVEWMLDSPVAFLARGYAHRVAAIVFVVLSLYHFYYLFLTQRGRTKLRAMKPSLQDLRDLGQQMAYYVGLRRKPARLPHFSYAEKLEYLALVWGSIIMVVTGVILWFEEQALGWMPKWAWDLSELIHLYEAWLASLSILVWHLYFVMFRPSGHGLSFAMFTGELTEEEMHHEHAGELDDMTAGKGLATSHVLAPGEEPETDTAIRPLPSTRPGKA